MDAQTNWRTAQGVVIVALLGAVALLTACDTQPKTARRKLPVVHDRAVLPPPPVLAKGDEVLRFPDGSYSVEGLLRQGAALIGQEVRVKGFVRDVAVCDPAADPACTTGPHAFLVDDVGRPHRAMLVVGSAQSALRALKAGQGETLTGTIANLSPDGRFIRARGMLLLPDLPPEPAATPEPTAPTAPATETP